MREVRGVERMLERHRAGVSELARARRLVDVICRTRGAASKHATTLIDHDGGR
jgi:hypothetical protein